jgi:hypothetical protein
MGTVALNRPIVTVLTDDRGLINSSQGPPAADLILMYDQDKGSFVTNSLSDGLTRYITEGGAVSAPSEYQGFYFSGVPTKNEGVITADNVTETLIIVKMLTMDNQAWTNYTLPDSIPGRSNAELVWIPVSQSGVLIAIGGVLYSYALSWVLTKTQAAANVRLFETLTLSSFSRGR